MIRYLVVLSMLYLFSPSYLYGEVVETLTVGFRRTMATETSLEVIEGNIYYQARKETVLEVVEPIKQWMVFKGKTVLIYYPEEEKAFRLTSDNPSTVPFLTAFVVMVKEDLGLSEAGFSLVRNEMRNDTLTTYWEPPKTAREALANITVGMVKDRLVFVEIHDLECKEKVKTTYHKHFEYGGAFFPLEVISVSHQEGSPSVERITYSNPQFNLALPEAVTDFRIPSDIEATEVKW